MVSQGMFFAFPMFFGPRTNMLKLNREFQEEWVTLPRWTNLPFLARWIVLHRRQFSWMCHLAFSNERCNQLINRLLVEWEKRRLQTFLLSKHVEAATFKLAVPGNFIPPIRILGFFFHHNTENHCKRSGKLKIQRKSINFFHGDAQQVRFGTCHVGAPGHGPCVKKKKGKSYQALHTRTGSRYESRR